MGIPGLAQHLKPYAVSNVVGCKTPNCEEHRSYESTSGNGIIIDGPSFAYAIYHRLVVHKRKCLPAVEALPSYEEVGKGALAFLDKLESYGLRVEMIYFDGYLPTAKRGVRIERLRTSLRNLAKHHAIHRKLDCCKREWSQPLPPTVVFQIGSPIPSGFRSLPSAPFVVPAVLDAINSSKYVTVTSVVPGEAETYCAAAARRTGGFVLSNDSDLYVYDLGPGAFVNLDSVELHPFDVENQADDAEDCKTVRLNISRPRDIAKRLGVNSLGEIAFQFVTRHLQTLPEAINAAKIHKGEDSVGYSKFLREYAEPPVWDDQQFPPEMLGCPIGRTRSLDPRISELICQLESKNCNSAVVYLLALIEDPSRSSAWLVSSEQRSFAYSICARYCNRNIVIPMIVLAECNRKGPEYINQKIPFLSEAKIIAFTRDFQSQLRKFASTFSDASSDLIWRIYALFEVYLWHLDNDKVPPSREQMRRALTGTSPLPSTWEDIHLSAQLQAMLYSLRMVQQTLAYIMTARSITPELEALATLLDSLPPLARLMPSPFELTCQAASLEVESTLHQLAVLLQEATGCEDLSAAHKSKNDGMTMVASTEYASKQKRKKTRRKKLNSDLRTDVAH